MRKIQKKFLYLIGGVLVSVCLVAVGFLAINTVYAQYGGGGWSVDTTAPTISNIKVAASAETATITWTTDETSISWVVYGTTTSYGLEEKTTSYVTSHSVALSDLSSETTYHFSVKSKDSAGNIGSYADKTFITLAEGEEEEVVVVVEEEEKPIIEMTKTEIENKMTQVIITLINLIRQLIVQLQQQMAQLLAG